MLLLFCMPAASNGAVRFRHLSMAEGLSQLSVLSIYQDCLGRMWFGTEEGINIFDGNNVTAIKKFNGITSRDIEVRQICGDSRGNIYFMLGSSVVGVDFETQGYTAIAKDGVSALSCHGNTLYYARGNRLFARDTASRKTRRIGAPCRTQINAISVDSRGTLWAGATDGLYAIGSNRRAERRIRGAYVEYIYEDSHGNIWASSRDNGCYRIARDGGIAHYSIDNATAQNENNNALTHNLESRTQRHISCRNVRQIAEDSHGNIWIGTFFGLNRLDPRTGSFTVYSHTDNPRSLSHQSVFPLVRDNHGTMWLGTYYGGVNFFTPDNDSFMFYPANINDQNCLSNSFVGNITTDKRGDVWVCTEGGGLNRIDHNTHHVRHYMANSTANSLPQNNLKCIAYDSSRDRIYIGTYMGGVSALDIASGKFTNMQALHPEMTAKSGNRIIDMALWHGQLIFTTQTGLWIMNPDNYRIGKLITSLDYSGEMHLHIDRHGFLWTADGDGVRKISVARRAVVRTYPMGKAGLGEAWLTCISEDPQGRIYVASVGGGFYRLDERRGTFRAFDTENSDIMSNFCYAFTRLGNMLVYNSGHGVGLFNTTDGTFRNIEFSRDFPLTGINRGCGLFAAGTTLYIGGTNGLVVMNVGKLLAMKTSGRLFFSRMEVNGKACLPDDGTDILERAVYLTDKIRLNHDQNNITFWFADDNFSRNISQPLYEYRLLGYDDNWRQTSDKSISYPKLPAGKYTLEVREKPTAWQTGKDVATLSMQLTVSPPFYLSTFAYIIYIAIAVALAWAFYHFKRSQLLLETSLAIEKKDRQNVEALNKAKLQFFTSISHEFRTPLTLIIAKLDYVMQNVQRNTAIAKSLKSINQNAGMMLGLVNELLDFRKMEQGYTHLSVGRHDLVEFVKDIKTAFDDVARTKGISYSLSAAEPHIDCWFDQRQMQKVVYNLISNAFKYVAPHTGMIEIRIDQTDDIATLRVIDNGTGIAACDIGHIFDRFYQANNGTAASRATRGTGIGLALVKQIVERHHGSIDVLSSEGCGSMFVVQLRKDNTMFTKEELCEMEPADTPAAETGTAANDGGGMAKVLLVEDNDELLDTLADIFSPMYTLLTAHNGKEGLDITRAESPDIIVSDVMMPVMDGMEMCKAIKGDMSVCHIPILLLTAMSATEHEVEGLRCGADDYVAKPFNPTVLLARVAAHLRMRSLLQQRFSSGGLRMADAQRFAANQLDREFMERCDNFIASHIADSDFSVDDIARELLMSRTGFYSKFKAITSMTPNEYVMRRRLAHAADFLRENATASIADAAYKFGFSSPRYFSQCFKKHYGDNPTEWRNKENTKE